LLKAGKKLPLRETHANGFDYRVTLVGKSAWLGKDGKPVTVYYDPSTGAAGLTVAQYVLEKIEDVMRSCDAWFGVSGLGGNIIVAPDFGGAYHYGCSFDQGGDWYLSLSDQDTTVGLAVAEITESYMGLQAKGWNCGGSGGEALSRVLAEIATGGPDGAMRDYSAGPSWTGADWINRDSGTDQDYPSTGCGVLYLWWLLSLGHTVEQIVQAGESGGVLAGNYRDVTGKKQTDAWTDFKAAIKAIGGAGSMQNDNPFGAKNPPYPAGGPTPPPPPPPSAGDLLDTRGTLTVDGKTFDVEVVMSLVGSAPQPTNISLWVMLHDISQIVAAISTQDPIAIAAAVAQLLKDLGIKATKAEREKIVEKLRRSGTVVEADVKKATAVLDAPNPPKA